ncbi:MAG: membrane protein insertase YidC [Verrucomicrobiota bacterium]
MDRKSIIAVVLSVIVLAAWQYQNQKNLKQWQDQQAALAALAPKPSPSATAAPTAAPALAAPVAVTPKAQEAQVVEELKTINTPAVDYTFTNLGGGISKLTLLKHEGAKPGERMVLNAFGERPIGAIFQKPDDLTPDAYTVTAKGGQVVCERTDSVGLQVTKTFSLPSKVQGAETYTVQMEVAFANRGAAPVANTGYYVFAGSAEPIHASDMPTYTGFDWSKDGKATNINTGWFSAGKVPLVGVETSAAKSQYEQSPGNVVWAGVTNQYFTSLLSAVDPQNQGAGLGVWAAPISLKLEDKDVKGIEGALQMPGFKLDPGQTLKQTFTIYAGPKEYRWLKQLGHGESELMNFGVFKLISIFLLRTMNKLNDWFHSYAWAIIVLTFVVRGALWPIQGAATKSMKKMQLLQPKMTELKEKYKDDPAKMNQEVMKLYKDYGVNPFSGCLPMFIQIPIFFGFYSMLGTAVELRNSSFLWVHDLSRPDTIFHLAGIPVNILPLAMAGTMILQMQLTPKSGDPAQQKMFMLMPLVFVFMTYNFASALALYYTIQNILSIVQLYVTRNQAMPTLQKVSVPSKKPRK